MRSVCYKVVPGLALLRLERKGRKVNTDPTRLGHRNREHAQYSTLYVRQTDGVLPVSSDLAVSRVTAELGINVNKPKLT